MLFWKNKSWSNSNSVAECSYCHKKIYHPDYRGVQLNYKFCPYCGKRIGIENKLCPSCGEVHEVQRICVMEKNRIKGKWVEYPAVYDYCDKADEYFEDEELITANWDMMKQEYRKQNPVKAHLLSDKGCYAKISPD